MENTHKTQVEKVLSYLKQGRSITQVEAIRLFKCCRLSAIIKRLRNQGHEILTYNERNHFGISFGEAEKRLLTMIDNRQQIGVSNDGILVNPSINLNRVQ